MAFFQNNNTATTSFLFLNISGNDEIPTGVPDMLEWDRFLTDPQNTDRKQAFREFTFILFYFKNRWINGYPFPHTSLYDVFKHFIETDSYFKPLNSSAAQIFTPDGSGVGGATMYEPDSYTGDNLPQLKGEGLSIDAARISVYNAILTALNNDVYAGTLSLGTIREASQIFAYFYLTRQLLILNGYIWKFDEELYYPGTSTPPGSYFAMFYKQRSAVAPSGGLSPRTTEIVSQVNKAPANLPYYFNNLMAEMGINPPSSPTTVTGFIIPTRPVSSLTNPVQRQLAYFTELLDPIRPVGVVNPIAKPSPNTYINRTSTNTRIDIVTTGGSPTTAAGNYSYNNFIQDMYDMISSFNRISGSGINQYYIPSIPIPLTSDQVLSEVSLMWNRLQQVTQDAIKKESDYICSVFLKFTSSSVADNSILATGTGETTISLLGIQNFGLPLYGYSLSPQAVVSDTQTTTRIIERLKEQTVHLSVFALDLWADSPLPNNLSDLEITVSEIKSGASTITERYLFNLNPGNPTKRYIEVKSTPGSDFYTVINPTTHDAEFHRRFSADPADDIIIAKYDSSRSELTFISMTTDQLSLYSLNASKTLTIKTHSKSKIYPTGSTTYAYEEFLLFVSSYENNGPKPGLFVDDVRYAPETFQLVLPSGSGASLPTENASSYTRLFNSERATLKVLFDALKAEIGFSPKVTFTTPALVGGFVGKKTGTSSKPAVVADTNYTPKFPAGTKNEHLASSSETTLSAFLKYSWCSINLVPHPTISGNYTISISIKSHVSFTPSSLSNKYSGNVTIQNRFISKRNGGSNNQILAMLRSFGMLEGVVNKMLEELAGYPDTVYSLTEKAHIKSRIKEWLPDPNPTLPVPAELAAITCVDESFSIPGIVLANPINLQEYYEFRLFN